MFPSYYFTRKEFCCLCCSFDTVDGELLRVLNDLRFSFSAQVIINSGCRCVKHNADVGGTPESQHLLGKAADIVVKGIPAKEIYDHLTHKYIGMYGIGLYDNFVHLDVRNKKARW